MMTMLIIAVVTALAGAGVKDFWVSQIHPIGEVICNFRDESITERCFDFKPPAKVAVGETFSAEGLRRVIRFVVATRVEEDNTGRDMLMNKGRWSCVAAETRDDLGENQAHRVWLSIPRCTPAL